MKVQWARKRYFVGYKHSDKRHEIFTCRFDPTETTHGRIYGHVFGPYRTKKEAMSVKGYQSRSTVKLASHQI